MIVARSTTTSGEIVGFRREQDRGRESPLVGLVGAELTRNPSPIVRVFDVR